MAKIIFDRHEEKEIETELVFNNDLSFTTDKDKLTHQLIIGENYDALKHLLNEYKGRIDVIYIDPPYGLDSKRNGAKTNYNNDIQRDKLLSMLENRLLIAKDLMSDEGVIFCSIDDKNQAYVKCLFDEVFGEENFVANISVINNQSGRSDDLFFATSTEYLLVYSKNIKRCTITGFLPEDDYLKQFNKEDEWGRYKESDLKKTGKNCRREDRRDMYYPIYFNQKNNTFESVKTSDEDIEIYPPLNEDGTEGRWRWGKSDGEKFSIYNNSRYLVARKMKSGWRIKVKDRPEINANGEERRIKPKTHWDKAVYSTTSGSSMLKLIGFSKELFNSPKSVDFIKDIITISSNKNAIILDFFAGSGTTGQAVLELNREDGGTRQFILCTNNEITKTTPNGIAYDVTSKRLKRVMTGECYDGTNDFDWIKKNEAYGDNLDVYEIKEKG